MSRNLTRILIGLVGLIVLFLGLAAVLPGEYSIVWETEINGSPDEVFRRVAYLNRWPEWSPWYEQEPEAVYEFKGTPGETGSSMSWKGQKVGIGSITLQTVKPNTEVVSRLEFSEPEMPPSTDRWTFLDPVPRAPLPNP